MTASPPAAPARRPSRPVVLLVPVPGTSPIHRLWAGTKLLVVFVISVLLTFYPSWLTIVLVAVLVLVTGRLAHIPRGALPSVPRLMWLILALGGVTAALAGGHPVLSIGGVDIGLGGVLNFVRISALSVVLLGVGAMVSWTTNVAEIGPALATLSRPFKWVRIPVDEWAVATALALRAFPMLIDEFQVLYAARRLRPKQIPQSRRARRQQQVREMIDLLAAAITVTLRRADEMGDAITARGGTGQLAAAPARPKLADWLTLAIVFTAGGTAIAVETIFHLTQ
ncbi:Energy-coupling factor transporter transmembrane protein EcfT [Mycobacterium rhizamassiliense]|uniref:Energy-coupling factor transporter transmembrane protein EcfT n=1 Tax=Mycobacterium rhizamassiliense TaxID=1841860 RepID=A0A2U3NX02_9MYCO|nr:energy-coupling factor transporter transmembrane protein EcfT [Mycobacterium rhizamassiliense]SPM36008.1 Energy-coupling factor transporter transmembrane protein EcfT [Mycobacterium rhizamassiliense]